MDGARLTRSEADRLREDVVALTDDDENLIVQHRLDVETIADDIRAVVLRWSALLSVAQALDRG